MSAHAVALVCRGAELEKASWVAAAILKLQVHRQRWLAILTVWLEILETIGMTRLRRLAYLTLALAGIPHLGHAQEMPETGVTQGASDADRKEFDEWLAFFRERRLRSSNSGTDRVDEATYVKISAIEQWITVRGQNRSNPVILFLHGGPGDVTNPWSHPYFLRWQKYFTVVQWDQRGAGRTLAKTGQTVASTMTIEPETCVKSHSDRASERGIHVLLDFLALERKLLDK